MAEPHSISADEIDALLPQTQCARCGFPACRPYAEALAQRRAPVNRCPPGGETTIAALARLLESPRLRLDPDCGPPWSFSIAFIDEAWCIGCTICIRACPVDAIAGASKLMHTVIARDCTGCELCVAPCPTDCIRMLPVAEHPQRGELPREWGPAQAARARRRFERRRSRLAAETLPRSLSMTRAKLRALSRTRKRTAIDDAVRRVRARRATQPRT